MELPEVGDHCIVCGGLDFIPFTCPHCNNKLCGNHASLPNHKCKIRSTSHSEEVVGTTVGESISYTCTFCKRVDKINANCEECGFNHCLQHRAPQDHNCRVIEHRNKLKLSQAHQETASITPPVVWKPKPVKAGSKNEALAAKVSLIKLKQNAEGDNSVAAEERRYFRISLPNSQDEKCVYFNQRISIGRVVDSLCNKFKVSLKNNELLVLTLLSDQQTLPPSSTIGELETQGKLINGQTIYSTYK